MPAVRRNIDKRTGRHFDLALVEPQPGGAFEKHDPLMLVLVEPGPLQRIVTERDDSFNPNGGPLEDPFEYFARQVLGNIGQQIREVCHQKSVPRS